VIWFEKAPLIAQIPVVFILVLLPALFFHWILSTSAQAREWCRGVVPPTITAVALCFGLMAASVAVDVMGLFDNAKTATAREVTALDMSLKRLDLLPGEFRDPAKKEIENHMRYVITEEWPLMESRAAPMVPKLGHLDNAYALVAGQVMADAASEEVRKRILTYLDEARMARTSRILISQGIVSPLKWFVLIALTLLLQMDMAAIHAGDSKARLFKLLLLALAQGTVLIAIVAFNHPFGGDITVEPKSFQVLLPP
jgi:hypothetical protein